MDEKDELVKEFLIESFEYLDSLDEDLLSLEKDASDPDLLARIFRALHTIKGTGGFLDFENLVGIAHAGEGLLDCLRKGTVNASEEVSSALFDLVDAIREVLGSIEQTGLDGEQKYSELVKTLVALQGGKAVPLPEKPESVEELTAIVEEAIEEIEGPAAEATPEPAVEEAAPEKKAKPVNDNLDEGMREYIDSTNKILDNIDVDLQQFKTHPLDTDLLERIMKKSRKVVGTSTIMGYSQLINIFMAVKEQLDLILNGENAPSFEIRDLLRAHVEAAREILGHIEETEKEGPVTFKELVEKYHEVIKKENEAKAEEAKRAEEAQKAAEAKKAEIASNGAEKDDAAKVAAKEPANQAPAPAPTANKEAESTKRSSDQPKRSLADNNIRVNVDLLDALMNLVGELVLTRNQILQFTTSGTNPALANSAQNLDLITTELQEGVMKTRMQTIGTIWKKFPRVVRDLAKLCDKKARVVMEGEDTELDKTIIEAIKDPLTHLIRNSVDHGIEMPDERVKIGKSAEGILKLRAYHEGGHVNIEISDDGSGINPEVIKKKALNNGVITQAQATRMSDREILNLIFVSGLSTAQKVSNISGRGVGMDVVKTYIERIGGTVDISSKMGAGTTIKIKIPLTLAIIPALIVKVCGERFALPQVNLLELVRLEGDQIQTGIEMIHDTPVYRLRGKLLPLVYLDKVLGLKDEVLHNKATDELAVINIVVLQAEDQPFGLVVNEVVDTGEVVVKPLSKLLKHVSTYAGATIMGDGKIALILDVAGLARNGGVMSQQDNLRAKSESMSQRHNTSLTTLLLARVNHERQIAIPLSMISRLEEINANTIEKTGHQEIVQYRGHIMPLVRLTRVLGLNTHFEDKEDDLLHVFVCAKNGVNIGMIVEEIIDIVEEPVALTDRPGIVKSVGIIQNKATDFLSIQEILDSIDTGVFELDSEEAAMLL